MVPILLTLWTANNKVYGARKLWKAARRAGHDIGRDQVARLMRSWASAVCAEADGCSPPGATPGPSGPRIWSSGTSPPTAPNQLWVTDLTYVADLVRGGLCVLHRRRVLPDDRRLAGRGAHAHRHGPRRVGDGRAGHAAPASRGSSPTPMPAASSPCPLRRTTRRAGAAALDRRVGDSYDNALAETVNGLYKTELIRGPEPGTVAHGRRRRAGHPRLGPLAQHRPAPRLPRRRPTRRVRSSVLRCPTDRPGRGWKPITRASTEPRAVHRRDFHR